MSQKGKKKHSSDEIIDHESDQFWKYNVKRRKTRQIHNQKYDADNISRTPGIMQAKGHKVRKGMITAEKRAIEEEIIRADSSIGRTDAFAGELGLMDCKVRGLVFIAVITEEQYLNQLVNFGSLRQKDKENQQLNLSYLTESQEDLGQSSMLEDQQPVQTVAQEKLTEGQCQATQKDIIKSENVNIVHYIGALDWSSRPINDIYNRNPFETYKTGYNYDALRNLQAQMNIRYVP
ncbi:MAG: hypothetical protein EZS28_007439 [Streblomastix strix]|uniref:Uncharacterized protein n=1 Tax=Streblomastix strix TaxID=222440 RepID=A0A5J4WRL6_9EUKA|nr:MAG: hypothetical protein EZS28_007439 [Streblomastix strix]